jgi:hypothetical protein
MAVVITRTITLDTPIRILLDHDIQLRLSIEHDLGYSEDHWRDFLMRWPLMPYDVIQMTQSHYNTNAEKGRQALQIVSNMECTVGQLAAGLDRIYFQMRANAVRAKVGVIIPATSGASFNVGISATTGVFNGPFIFHQGGGSVTASAPTPMQASAPVRTGFGGRSMRKRDKDDIQFVLEQYPAIMLKIDLESIGQVKDGGSLPAEVMFFGSTKDADERADEFFEQDVEEAGGDEKRVPHGYLVIGAGDGGETKRTWHASAAKEKAKSRGKALGENPATAAPSASSGSRK